MRCDGDREALRILMIDRDHAVDSVRSARAVLTSLIVTSPADLRERLRGLERFTSSCRGRRTRTCGNGSADMACWTIKSGFFLAGSATPCRRPQSNA